MEVFRSYFEVGRVFEVEIIDDGLSQLHALGCFGVFVVEDEIFVDVLIGDNI